MNDSNDLRRCFACPRRCGADRKSESKDGNVGFCRVGDEFIVSRAEPHMWEEPPISGKRGSGTIFFSGCNMRCVFCQNYAISHTPDKYAISDSELETLIFSLIGDGVHNINLVTPTHYSERLAKLLGRIKDKIKVPIVWNSGGYESVETLRTLDGLVDVYLPDFKYFSPELSGKYSACRDYFGIASGAIREMYRQVGRFTTDGDGIAKKGLIVRHLVLPGCRKDSIALLEALADIVPPGDIKLSLMSQYTPDFAKNNPDAKEYTNLHRRLTSFEYSSVLEVAEKLGFDGYFQLPDSATSDYTPDFEHDVSVMRRLGK